MKEFLLSILIFIILITSNVYLDLIAYNVSLDNYSPFLMFINLILTEFISISFYLKLKYNVKYK